MKSNITWAAGVLVLALASCSGGSSGGSSVIVGLSAPGNVAVVSADESVAPPVGGVAPGASVFDPTSDFVTDKADVWVYDPSMETLGTINMILCFMDRTAYDEMVNLGTYNAQIDTAQCEGGNDDSDDAGQSSGAEGGEIEMFVVNSTRLTPTSPQFVSIWVPQEEQGMAEVVRAQMTITEGATEADEFGQFHMDFAGVPDGGVVGNPSFNGALATVDNAGEGGFLFYEERGDINAVQAVGEESRQVQVNVTMNPNDDSGAAHILTQMRYNFGGGDSGIQSEEWKVVFDATHMKRQSGADPVVTLDRNAYDTNVMRYNLYRNAEPNLGERVELNSGFNFQTAGGEYGWIGYYGMWTPDGTVVNNGDTVTEDNFGDDGVGAAYTVVKAPGKLIRHTRNTLPLADLAGQLLNWHEAGTDYLVDHDGVDFRRTASYNTMTESWDSISPPTVIDVAAAGGWLGMWSGALGGQVSYVDGDAFVTFFEEGFVNGSDAAIALAPGGELVLYGYFNCLKTAITSGEADTGDIFLADAVAVGAPHVFRINDVDVTLDYDADGAGTTLVPVGLGAGQEPTTGPNMWGMRSGPMVASTAGLVNTYDIWNVVEFYTYETGHNEWNQSTTVQDAMGAYVEFDAPLQFLYGHETANDFDGDATYDGQSYFLNYGGPGNMWGIPHEGVDLDGDLIEDRWYPLFSIADGTEMGPTGNEYVVRAIEMEQTLTVGGAAPLLDITDANGLVLPDSALYSAPTLGAMPTVTGPPAVIDGEVQGTE